MLYNVACEFAFIQKTYKRKIHNIRKGNNNIGNLRHCNLLNPNDNATFIECQHCEKQTKNILCVFNFLIKFVCLCVCAHHAIFYVRITQTKYISCLFIIKYLLDVMQKNIAHKRKEYKTTTKLLCSTVCDVCVCVYMSLLYILI